MSGTYKKVESVVSSYMVILALSIENLSINTVRCKGLLVAVLEFVVFWLG